MSTTLIPTAYQICFGGLPGTVIDILANGPGWSAHDGFGQHLVYRPLRRGGPPEFYWEDDGWNNPHIFDTAREAADAAEQHPY